MRAALVLMTLAGCGRIDFGYPIVPCENVIANASTLSPDDKHCYTRHDVGLSLYGAESACASIGGHVATITSPGENDDIVAGLALAGPTRIGLITDGALLGGWSWDDGEPVPYANFAPGQPQPCTLDSATALIAPDGAWSTTCVGDGRPYLCEIEPWRVRDDGHAYRVYWGATDWFGASSACQALGAHLATINSADEATFVAPLITDYTWLGASTASGSLAWVTGEPFGAFTPWASGDPNGTGLQCLVSLKSLSWADTSCTDTYRALCETD